MFPLCLPFVTPGTEMSLRKETHTHTPQAEDTRSVRSAEATELVCENKWKGGKKTHTGRKLKKKQMRHRCTAGEKNMQGIVQMREND